MTEWRHFRRQPNLQQLSEAEKLRRYRSLLEEEEYARGMVRAIQANNNLMLMGAGAAGGGGTSNTHPPVSYDETNISIYYTDANPNYQGLFYNYKTNTATTIDFGIPHDTWSYEWGYLVQYGGYMIYFYLDGADWIIMTDTAGNVMYDSGQINNLATLNSASGIFMYFYTNPDGDGNQQFTWSDGLVSWTTQFAAGTGNISVPWNWDASSTKGIVVRDWDGTNTTLWLLTADRTQNGDGNKILLDTKTGNSIDAYYVYQAWDGVAAVVSDNGSTYNRVKLWDSRGNLVTDYDLGQAYGSFTFYFYGNGKWLIVFYAGSDFRVVWYNANGISEQTISVSGWDNCSTIYTYDYISGLNNCPAADNFYFRQYMNDLSREQLVPLIGDATSMGTPIVIADGTSIGVYTYYQNNNGRIYGYLDSSEGGLAHMLFIKDGSITNDVAVTEVPTSAFSGVNIYTWKGGYFVVMFNSSDHTAVFYVFDSIGNILVDQPLPSWNINIQLASDIMTIGDYSVDVTWIYTKATGLTTIDTYYPSVDVGYFDTPDNTYPRCIVMYDGSSFEFTTVNSAGPATFTGNGTGSINNINPGETIFAYTFADGDGHINLCVYDYRGVLLHEIDTGFSSEYAFDLVADRGTLAVHDDDNNILYYYSFDGAAVTTTTMTDYTNGWIWNSFPNDYPWWND